jgi:hypothetical protein
MHCVIYNLNTGLVNSVMYGVTDLSKITFDSGTAGLLIENPVDHQTSRVVDGNIVTIPKQPGSSYVWQQDGWVDTTPITRLKAQVEKQINEERNRINLFLITFNGVLFDADEIAQQNIQSWVTNIAAGQLPPADFKWRAYDNTYYPADASFITGLWNAITARKSRIFERSWIKKAELQALTTVEEVKAYDVKTGWF